jgi:MoaA/NifB/PqqE/SkfB family radical SAM enzyme
MFSFLFLLSRFWPERQRLGIEHMCFVTIAWNKSDSLAKLRGHRADSGLRWAYLEVTGVCDLQCPYCYNRDSEVILDSEISVDVFRRAILRLQSVGIEQVTLSGGEPTLHSRLADLVSIASTAGLSVHLCSNGRAMELNEMSILVESGLTQVQVNVDHMDHEMHDKWRGKDGSHSSALATLGKWRQLGVATVGMTVVHRENIKDLIRLSDWLRSLSLIDRFRVMELMPNGSTRGWDCSHRQYIEAVTELVMHHASQGNVESVVSYDPDLDLPISNAYHVFCPIRSGLALNIKPNGDVVYCACCQLGQNVGYNLFAVESITAAQSRLSASMPPPCIGLQII